MADVRPSAAGTRPDTLSWGAGPLRFDLESADADVLRRAATVFRPWRHDETVRPRAVWAIRTDDRGSAWHVLRRVGGEAHLVETRPSAARAVTCVEFLAARALFDDPLAPLAFHAALVSRDGRAVLICGPSGAGKSTLACALWQHGCALLTDDTTVVDEATLVASGAPRRVSLREQSRALIGEALWARLLASQAGEPTDDGCLFHPAEVEARPAPPARLGACVFLARRGALPASAASLAPLVPAHAALSLLPYANLARHLEPGRALARLVTIAEAVPAFDLARGPLPAMVGAVDRLLEAR